MVHRNTEPTITIFGTTLAQKTFLTIAGLILFGATVMYAGARLGSKEESVAPIKSRAAYSAACTQSLTFYVGLTPTRTPTPSSSTACDPNRSTSRWATALGLISGSGSVRTDSSRGAAWPYFDPSGNTFTVNIPSTKRVAFLACYDCDHYGSDSSKGWKISWTGGSFEAKTSNNVWGTWVKSISVPNTVKYDGGGDSHGGNVCVYTP